MRGTKTVLRRPKSTYALWPADLPTVLLHLVGTALAFAAAVLVTTPGHELVLQAFVLALVLAGAIALPPEFFLAGCLLVIGTMEIWTKYSWSAGSAVVYGSDVFVGLAVVRGLLPRARRSLPGAFGVATRLALFTVMALLAIGVLRALDAGAPFDSAIRQSIALFYWAGLYFAFSRVFRERRLDSVLLIRLLVSVAIGLILYMLLMRVLGRPFESSTTVGRLGEVIGSEGIVLRRDFGFASAYIIYPVLALLAFAIALYTRQRLGLWIAICVLAVGATASTLIRAEIYGLAGGLAAVLLVSGNVREGGRRVLASQRMRAAALVVVGLAFVGAVLVAFSPSMARVIGERSLPGVTAQSAAASANAEYRLEALDVGIRMAGDHPLGLGFIAPEELLEQGVDPGYLAHSAPGSLLVYTGWPGLIAGLLALVALLHASARTPAAAAWLHPFFVGAFVMMTLYGFGASGLVGQPFVIATGALVLAARFAVRPPYER